MYTAVTAFNNPNNTNGSTIGNHWQNSNETNNSKLSSPTSSTSSSSLNTNNLLSSNSNNNQMTKANGWNQSNNIQSSSFQNGVVAGRLSPSHHVNSAFNSTASNMSSSLSSASSNSSTTSNSAQSPDTNGLTYSQLTSVNKSNIIIVF